MTVKSSRELDGISQISARSRLKFCTGKIIVKNSTILKKDEINSTLSNCQLRHDDRSEDKTESRFPIDRGNLFHHDKHATLGKKDT